MQERYNISLNSLLAVPICSGTRVLGAMIMVNRGVNDLFTDRDKTSVEVISVVGRRRARRELGLTAAIVDYK